MTGLSAEEFETAWANGSTLTIDEVAAIAPSAIRGSARLDDALETTKVFMFTEIVSSTPLASALGDAAWDAALSFRGSPPRSRRSSGSAGSTRW